MAQTACTANPRAPWRPVRPATPWLRHGCLERFQGAYYCAAPGFARMVPLRFSYASPANLAAAFGGRFVIGYAQ
jgi:hypothetical protein